MLAFERAIGLELSAERVTGCASPGSLVASSQPQRGNEGSRAPMLSIRRLDSAALSVLIETYF